MPYRNITYRLRVTNARYVSASCHAAIQKHHLHPEGTQMPGMCQAAVMQPYKNITYILRGHQCQVYFSQLSCSQNITYILRGHKCQVCISQLSCSHTETSLTL